jgi:mannose-6-phosphate isomerase
MDVYPLTFQPIYKEKIWGGRNLERLFGRDLPGEDTPIGESWELADLVEGTSVVANGPANGMSLTDLTAQMGPALLGDARPMPDGRFPLLLKLLDANETLSLQVHPDAEAVEKLPGAALKTECWYTIESRGGYIYKGVRKGVEAARFRQAIENDNVEQLVRRIDLQAGDFHFLPAGTVHALGPGLVVAEVQTPSDTTYRVTDWGRGREIHIDQSMQSIHFTPAEDAAPGADGETLLVTDYFVVARRSCLPGRDRALPAGRCAALMMLSGPERIDIVHGGATESQVTVRPGDTVLLPAGLPDATLRASTETTWLEVTLPAG